MSVLCMLMMWGCPASDTSNGNDTAVDTVDEPDSCDCECTCSPEDVQSALEDGPVDLASGSTVDGETILTAGDAISWNQLSDVPSGFADNEDDDTLAALSCAAGESPQLDPSGAWQCVALAEVVPTPTGMDVVLDSLIETSERGSGTWINAVLDCDAVGRRLCTSQELIAACSLGLLTDATDDAEWSGELSTPGFAMVVLGSTCTTTTTGAFASTHAHRCCQN